MLEMGLAADFHRRKGVAPLKEAVLTRPCPECANFHRRKGVAPLKELPMNSVSGRLGQFPPPKGGGSIEGTSVGRILPVLRAAGISTAERGWLH